MRRWFCATQPETRSLAWLRQSGRWAHQHTPLQALGRVLGPRQASGSGSGSGWEPEPVPAQPLVPVPVVWVTAAAWGWVPVEA